MEPPPVVGGHNRYMRRVAPMKSYYEATMNRPEMDFTNGILGLALPTDENDFVNYVNDPSNLVAWCGIFGFSTFVEQVKSAL